MKYSVSMAHGDAGEFFFAYKIASVLKWPCRLFDIDIGIDAQVEVLSDASVSTGKFVAFQVKASSKEEAACRYVSSRQLAYWRELELPVFIVLVDLKSERMYLHHVIVNKEYPVTEPGTVRIDFDLDAECFGEASARVIESAANQSALAHVERHLTHAKKYARDLATAIEQSRESPDPHCLIEIMLDRRRARQELANGRALSSALRVGDVECNAAEQLLDAALDELKEYMCETGMDVDWDGRREGEGEIAKFMNGTD